VSRKTYNDHPFFNPEEDEGFEPASVAYRCGSQTPTVRTSMNLLRENK
jgi:hypothetical protein